MAYSYEYPYTDSERSNADWLLNSVKEVKLRVDSLENWKETHETQYEELKNLYDAILSGNFPPSIINAFKSWMKENAVDLVGELVHNVFFGLDDSGYFIVYIPENWHDIVFNTTGLDIVISDVEYGRLVLSY